MIPIDKWNWQYNDALSDRLSTISLQRCVPLFWVLFWYQQSDQARDKIVQNKEARKSPEMYSLLIRFWI